NAAFVSERGPLYEGLLTSKLSDAPHYDISVSPPREDIDRVLAHLAEEDSAPARELHTRLMSTAS
ncbi:MAG: hypothetical protein AAGH73_05075, partial [Pseudomonadota bacterium]